MGVLRQKNPEGLKARKTGTRSQGGRMLSVGSKSACGPSNPPPHSPPKRPARRSCSLPEQLLPAFPLPAQSAAGAAAGERGLDVRTGPSVQRATASIRNTASLQPGEVRGRAVAAMARACKGGQEALLGLNGRRREERGPTGLAASQRSASRAASFFSEFAPGGCLVLGWFFSPLPPASGSRQG